MVCDFKMPKRIENSHKGTYGRILNVSGSDYMSGAAYLSSIAALTVGCGYVVLCSTLRVIKAVAAKSSDIVFSPLSDVCNQLEKANVLLFGCGLSTEGTSNVLFNKVFNSNINIPTVIDADGLNLLAKLDIKTLPKNLILTPHPKEAAGLLGVSTEEVLSDMEFYAKVLSKKYSCVTVLKSHNTVVCSKDLEIYTNDTGNSALSKAGSGDVLAGIIAGLLAQKCEPFYAAKLGVYLHGLCADIAKKKLTEYSLLASDIIKYIPKAIKTLL